MIPPVFEVCDAGRDPDTWTAVKGATDSRDAVELFLRQFAYDEAEFDTGFPFTLEVRSDGGTVETITVRVVPAHFEVA